LKWFEILKNIQISGQRTSSRDYVKPDEDDDTCRDRFHRMMEYIDSNWDSVTFYEEIDSWPDEIFCKALEYINNHTFLFHNPTHEGNKTDLFKYNDGFLFYEATGFKADYTVDLGQGFNIRLTYRMVAKRGNVINIFCQMMLGNPNMISFATFQINETFNVTGEEFMTLLSEEPYDDGVTTTSIPKDKEPSYITTRDWRKF
jgi:hypothetical protein